MDCDEQESEDISLLSTDVDIDFLKDDLIQRNIITYIAGFVVLKLSKVIKCQHCKSTLGSDGSIWTEANSDRYVHKSHV